MRAWIVALAIAAVALAAMACGSPAAPVQPPHENPDTALLVFDGVSLFQKYAEALEYIDAMDVTGMLVLLERESPAKISPEMRDSMNAFQSSRRSLGSLILMIEADQERLRTQTSLVLSTESLQSLEVLAQKLRQAYMELGPMDQSARDISRLLQVESAAEEGVLREAYEKVQSKQRGLGSLLDLFSETRADLVQQAEVEVIKAIPQIEVDAQGMVLVPFALNVRGKVYSALGPLQDAPLRIALGDWEVTTRSRDDGTFGARLSTGMSLTLVGTQELRVSVTPGEPWHSATSLATDVTVINPANIAGLSLALAIPVFLGASRVRRRAVPGPQPAPVLVRRGSPLPQAAVPVPEGRGSPRTILLALYWAVLRLVQRVTAVVLRPSHTLREYAQECTPGLGPLAGYFQEFTSIMEKLLYSRYLTGKAEAARGGELNKRLKEGLTGEDV